MKTSLIRLLAGFGVLLCVMPCPVRAQDAGGTVAGKKEVPGVTGLEGYSLSWVQRYDLRRRVDGKYLGIFYGRNQGSLGFTAPGTMEKDEFFSVQSMTDTLGKAVALEERRYGIWVWGNDGMLVPQDAGKPAANLPGASQGQGPAVASEAFQPGRFEFLPFLDPLRHAEGKPWKEKVLFCLMPESPEAWRWCIPQDLTLVNQGLVDWHGSKAWEFKATCTLQGSLPGAPEFRQWPSLSFMARFRPLPGLKAFSGKRELRILVDPLTLSPLFMQERLDAQTIGFESGKKIQNDGFVLTFYEGYGNGIPGIIRDDAAALRSRLADLISEPGPVIARSGGPAATAPGAPPASPGGPVATPPDPPAASLRSPVTSPQGPVAGPPGPAASPPAGDLPPTSGPRLRDDQLEPALQDTDSRVTMRSSPGGLVLEIPDLGFVADKAEFLPGEQARLASVARVLASLGGARFLVRGHTALWGSTESQESLALERARLVSKVLQDAGVDPGHLMFEGCGAREPKADNGTPEGRAKNRRVEILVIRGPGAK